jgi:hypothetical protein
MLEWLSATTETVANGERVSSFPVTIRYSPLAIRCRKGVITMVTLQELAERVERLEREVAALKAQLRRRPSRRPLSPEELERRRQAVAALEAWRERLKDRLKGLTLTDILMEMRYGSEEGCDLS